MPELFGREDILPGCAVDQPYAGLIMLGLKDLETRLRRVHKRGPIVVCATRKIRMEDLRRLRSILVPARVSAEAFDAAVGLVGCVVATGSIVGCRVLTQEDWPRALFWDGKDPRTRWAWELANVRPTVPAPIRCMPGFFPVPRALIVDARAA